jgi:hypothetical protein
MARRPTSIAKTSNLPATEPPHAARPVPAYSRRVRWLISLVLGFHLTAVFVGAWIGSPPTSPFADIVARPFRAYIAVADLNHGYRFFAPNPGPSHLFRYQLTFADGSTEEGYFPNRVLQWPRLLYHRYFMLAENLNVLRPDLPPSDTGSQAYLRMHARFESLARSYAAQLLRETQAKRIDWELVRHYQPSPAAVLSGRRLNDKAFFETLERGSLLREDVP